MLFVAFWEETLFRGYLITNIKEQLKDRNSGFLWALVLTSVLFGLAHFGTSNFSWLAFTSLALHGSAYGIAFLLNKNLGQSIGIHFAWNFCQIRIFGFNMSGFASEKSILKIDNIGPDLITGGIYGPEGGLSGIFGFLVILICLKLSNSRNE